MLDLVQKVEVTKCKKTHSFIQETSMESPQFACTPLHAENTTVNRTTSLPPWSLQSNDGCKTITYTQKYNVSEVVILIMTI